MEFDKDKEVYKAVLKAQNGNNCDIAKVVYLLFKEKLICKFVGNKPVWYEKSNDTEYTIIHEFKVRKMMFETTKRIFYQTAQFLYNNAFDDTYNLHKPHYIHIANLIIKASQLLCIHAQRNNIMKEVIILFFN